MKRKLFADAVGSVIFDKFFYSCFLLVFTENNQKQQDALESLRKVKRKLVADAAGSVIFDKFLLISFISIYGRNQEQQVCDLKGNTYIGNTIWNH